MKTALQMVAFLLLTSTVLGQAKQFDVVVYGGTAGGVMTAVAAAREGLTVAILEPGKHVGGMVTGGLSRTDFGRKRGHRWNRVGVLPARRQEIWPRDRMDA